MSDTKRRISNLLPEVIQTDVLKKFFAATADNLFQPENVQYLNGFIGQKPGWYDSIKDVYVNESTANRRNYQVEATAVSRDYTSNNVTHTLFYEDLLNNLRFQGGVIDDHNRLFEQEYYSFGVPFDIDKWINPSNYAWLATGPDVITLVSSTSIADIQSGASYTYEGNYFFASDTETIIDGTVTPLKFSNGLKLKFAYDINVNIRTYEYIVEGVGRKIFLVRDDYQSNIAWENPIEWDSAVWDQNSLYTTQHYIVIGRGSTNGNPWSIKNRWFHIDVLRQSKTNTENVTTNLAKRPILEFDRNIKLYDFATSFRGYINAVDTVTTNLDNIIGQSSYIVHGVDLYGNIIFDDTKSVTLDDNMIILFTNLSDPLANNKLYKVANLRDNASIILETVTNGNDVSGLPVVGDGVTVLQGPWYNATIDLPGNYINWYYNGTQWKQGQIWNPSKINQAPLFELYDVDGNNIADPAIYPLSNFVGSTLFEYQTQNIGPMDAYLGFIPLYDSNQPSEFLFENTIVSDTWSYQPSTVQKPIIGSFFWLTKDPVTGIDFYANNWFKSPVLSRQYVVNEFITTTNQTQFVVDQSPSTDVVGPSAITVQLQNTQLVPRQDFSISGTTVTLHNNVVVAANQNVKIRTWNKITNTTKNGYFEIPRNLQANPNTLNITTTSRSQLFAHFESILINQDNISGSMIGINNYRDTAQNQGLGTIIVQHRASMLKLMILNAINQTDVIASSIAQLSPMNIMQWAQREYLRFYNKFVNSVFNLYNQRAYTAESSPDQWVMAALKTINIGKTSSSPWANSGFDGVSGGYCNTQSSNPTYVPASATRLGVTPAYQPTAFFDKSQPGSPLSLRCHNGAIVVLKDFDNQTLGTIENDLESTPNPLSLTNPIARAWMQFEKNMFDSLPSTYRSIDALPQVDARTIFSGKWRTTNFSVNEKIKLLQPIFDRWSTVNQIDAFKNTTYSVSDQFTWNYSSCVDKDNQPVPGNWRGIYMHFYDTTTPHLTPWEMVGFSQKPVWWDSEYGEAPYTSGNLKMWTDLRDGRIPQGDRAGTHSVWARSGLLSYIPVDDFGDLLPPFLAGVVQSLPTVVQAKNDWQFGDRGPTENIWLTTVDNDIVTAQITYLVKPAQFIEYLWDGTRTVQIYSKQSNAQWIYTDTNSRKSNSQLFVHRENPQNVSSLTSSLTYYGSCGIQHWISEYLVNENLDITKYFGNIIRGSDANLGYRVGGFTDGSAIKLLVDSFGLSTNDSLLLPQEDITTILSRSGSVKEIFYTGVIVESMGSQEWRVIGYDSVTPLFTIIPSDTNGPKTTVVMDNARVSEYQLGKNNTTKTVPYGTIFSSRQEVYDFLISLGRYQTAQGWQFDQYSDSAGRVQDWSLSAREFLFWSQGPWAPGTFITLSPLALLTKFSTSFGMIQYVGGVVNGSYSLLDKGGRVIKTSDVDFLRIDDSITVRTLNDQGIYGLRLFVTSIEHALIFNNSTIFGDTVFDPLLDLRQARFKMLAFRSLNWNGRMDAPGYMVVQTQQTVGDIIQINNKIISNFEKSVDDIRTMYNIDVPNPYKIVTNNITTTSKQTQSNTNKISALSKHLIAYQSRDYLTNLLVDDATQFQFYQGMIQQKGTASTIDKLLRNTNVLSSTESFEYYEEFAFRSGMYGANDVIHGIDVTIIQNQVTSNPQLVELLGSENYDSPLDDTITIVSNDSRVVNKTETTPPWATRENYGDYIGDLPTAGYVAFNEVNYTVTDDTELLALWEKQNYTNNPLAVRNRVWKFIDKMRGWDIYRISAPSWKISSSTPVTGRSVTTIKTTTAHGLSVGAYVILQNIITSNGSIQGTYSVFNVSTYTFDISLATQSNGTGGTALVYQSVRFDNFQALQSGTPRGGWTQNELVYVDGDKSTPWHVYSHQSSYWVPTRTEELKIDTSKILNSKLYNKSTLANLGNLVLWDPIKGAIPAQVSKDLTYLTAYDPAKYNVGDTTQYEIDENQAWGSTQVGLTWWDLSTTRYIDYETGSNSYRRQWWGNIAPGTTVDIYEWIRSLVPPASWAGVVESGNSSATGGVSIPSGSVKNVNYPYVEHSERTVAGNYIPVYYFWIKNSATVPSVSFRSLSTLQMNRLITQPQNSNILWWSPISSTTALLGNISKSLISDQTVWQTNYISADSASKIYKQWTLLRPGDPQSYPTDMLWNRMRASLVEFDDIGNSVPNLYLPEYAKNGIQIRPSQSWFKNSGNARRAFVNSVNKVLNASTIAPALDPERIEWLEYFNSSEPSPSQNNTILGVNLATTETLNAIYYNGNNGIGSSLFSINPEILLIDGVIPTVGDRILIKDQASVGGFTTNAPAENGIYEVVSIGSLGTQWQLIRALDFSHVNDNLTNAQVDVTNGEQNAATTWYQTNPNVYNIGKDAIVWKKGKAPLVWDYSVNSLAERNLLENMIVPQAKVLVKATSATNNRWTIWQWQTIASDKKSIIPGWTLIRMQAWVTNNCWEYVDWYASGYNSSTQITYHFSTLNERNSYLSFKEGDIIKVDNTGNGSWNLYVYDTNSPTSFVTIGVQNGGIQLLDNLWDYEKYGFGYDGGNYGVDYQGFAYDTTVELNQIIQGLRPSSNTQSGLLKGDIKLNEWNTVFFDMIYFVFEEQLFVDWAFKTSFITLKGFAQELADTPYYTVNKIDSLTAYINEIKPYRVNIRQFVDFRKVSEKWINNSTDFDKQPYVTRDNQIRILETPADDSILSTNATYKPWFNHYQTLQEQKTFTSDGVTTSISMSKSVSKNVVFVKIDNLMTTNFLLPPNLPNLIVLKTAPPSGSIVTVTVYVPSSVVRRIHTQLVFDRTSCSTGSGGAADRITDHYQPTGDMIPLDSPLLISGCAPKGTILDGVGFTNVGQWGEPIWDNPEGWDQTTQSFEQYYDVGINGNNPNYWIFQGDGIKTSFELPWPPQQPSSLRILVSSTIVTTPNDWIIPNFVTQLIIANSGISYQVNDILTIQTGNATAFATAEVTNVNNVGEITGIKLLSAGYYTYVPDQITVPVTGGNGVNATVAVRWGGTSLQFSVPPSLPVKGPNIWIAEKGSTFEPALGTLFDIAYDGAGLNRAHIDGNHPEELMPLWLRDSMIIDTYVQPSGGFGNVLTQSFYSDGIIDQFIIGQPVVASNELIVSVNGMLKKQGIYNDYVVNIPENRVVFVNPPAAGTVTIVSVGFGGATAGVSDWSITNPGSDYNIGDVITLSGGTATASVAKISVSATKAMSVDLQNGGSNYTVGDLLLLKDGIGSQTLTLKVTSVTSYGLTTGIINDIQIINTGYYTSPSSIPSQYYTTGNGSGAEIVIHWGIAEIIIIDRGAYLSLSESLTQLSVASSTGGSSSGNGFNLLTRDTYIQESLLFIGDGATYVIPLEKPLLTVDSVLVVYNGEPTNAWSKVITANISSIALNFIPSVGDSILITVYKAKLFSLQKRQDFYVTLPTLAYNIYYPPAYSTNQTINSMVYVNGVKLRLTTDYSISGSILTFVSGTIATGDTVSVITWSDDSTASFRNDQYVGNTTGLYMFSQLPADLTGVQVWANGEELNLIFDFEFKKIGTDYYVSINHTYGPSDNIEIYYPTLLSAKSSVAWRSFQNIYGDTQYLRISNDETTELNADLNWDDQEIRIKDGTNIVIPQGKRPGVVWIGNERIEYFELVNMSTDEYPNQISLHKFNRGSLGTASGVPDKFITEYWDGTGQTDLFLISIINTTTSDVDVNVDGIVKIQNVDYSLVINPFGVAAGLYLQFASHAIPQAGNNNIKLNVFQSDWTTTKLCFPAGTIVRDGSTRQVIPGGYIWPDGNQGIQYSNSYQTQFLFDGPTN